jgi:hypothetical protein
MLIVACYKVYQARGTFLIYLYIAVKILTGSVRYKYTVHAIVKNVQYCSGPA